MPVLLGALLGALPVPRLSRPTSPSRSFVLFMGVSMSITAFPVLARILAERRLLKTQDRRARDHLRGGRRRDRVVHARVRGLASPGASMAGARAHRCCSRSLYIAVMFFVVRPFLRAARRA